MAFSWIVHKSRAQRDRVMKQIMANPHFASMAPRTMPFDGNRMFWGGFKPIVSL